MPQLAFYPNFQMPAGMAAYTAPTISGMDTMGSVAMGSMPLGSMPLGNMGMGGLAPTGGGQFAAQAMQVSPCQTAWMCSLLQSCTVLFGFLSTADIDSQTRLCRCPCSARVHCQGLPWLRT